MVTLGSLQRQKLQDSIRTLQRTESCTSMCETGNESSNSHLKEWKSLKDKCRHGLTKHSAMFCAVVVVLQTLLIVVTSIFWMHTTMMTISQTFLSNLQPRHYSNNNKPSLYVTMLESTKLIGLFLAEMPCCHCEQSCAISEFFLDTKFSSTLAPNGLLPTK